MNRSVHQPSGLTTTEAMARLARDGYNELPSAKPRSLWAIAWEVVREPMFALLIGASAIYLVLGDIREALVLFASVFVVMGITFYQERKTERALEALRELASPRAQVLRDGEWQSLPGREVVLGDVVRVKEGDRVPADALVLSGNNLMADESLLTGESVPVRKRAGDDHSVPTRPGGDDLPFVYSGTLLTQGQGVARVASTGVHTEIGKIGKALQTLVPELSTIQRDTRRAVVIFAAVGLALCVFVTVLYAYTRGDWLNGLLAGITLAMANLPEEMPVVLTVFLALGAWRISQRGVLTRQPSAIETLGSATVLCVDKTGTLTQNRMAVRKLWTPGKEIDVQDSADTLPPEVIEVAMLASEREPFDPMEKAYHRLARDRTLAAIEKFDAWTLAHRYPLSPEQLSVAHVWKGHRSDGYMVAAKGAPEAVAEICELDGAQRAEIRAQVARMAGEGLRVLAVARGALSPAHGDARAWPTTQGELRLRFVGLTGLADPIRPAVPAALRECYAAGIRTVMITGDYAGTAQAIARQIGLAHPDAVVTGPELDAMTDAQLRERVSQVNIFARVVPEQKLRLVQAFKANGEVVAMTGDGVNDAPALKAAHIGVAMGKRGSDVAREASSLVLLEDDFASMVEAIRLGRRIFANIQKAMSLHHRRARADRGYGAAAASLRLAIGVLPGAYRVSRIRHRPGMFDRFRGGTCRPRRDASTAACRNLAPAQRVDGYHEHVAGPGGAGRGRPALRVGACSRDAGAAGTCHGVCSRGARQHRPDSLQPLTKSGASRNAASSEPCPMVDCRRGPVGPRARTLRRTASRDLPLRAAERDSTTDVLRCSGDRLDLAGALQSASSTPDEVRQSFNHGAWS